MRTAQRPEDNEYAADAGPGAHVDLDCGPVLPLYTPAEAAEMLAVRESWLRRRAAARAVPCTFLGKHLRFSRADVVAIAAAAAHPPATTRPDRPRGRGRAAVRRR